MFKFSIFFNFYLIKRTNQCIGARNYKYFISFILLHSILTLYAGVLGFSILYTYILKNRLFQTKFYNKLTSEQVDNSFIIIMKYVISKNYIFFASNVLLITIGITLLIFSFYHFNLLRLNLTTNEKIKRDKMIKYMIIIKDTMKNLYLSGEFKEADNTKKRNFVVEYDKESNKINLSKEDEKKYDDIVFNSKALSYSIINLYLK